MVSIIQANRDELAYARERNAEARRPADNAEAPGVDAPQSSQGCRRQLIGAQIGQMWGQVSQSAIRMQQAGLFTAGIAVTKQFHEILTVIGKGTGPLSGHAGCEWS